MAKNLAYSSSIFSFRSDYSPWAGKRSMGVAVGAAEQRPGAEMASQGEPRVPKPKKFLPWVGKRSQGAEPRVEIRAGTFGF